MTLLLSIVQLDNKSENHVSKSNEQTNQKRAWRILIRCILEVKKPQLKSITKFTSDYDQNGIAVCICLEAILCLDICENDVMYCFDEFAKTSHLDQTRPATNRMDDTLRLLIFFYVFPNKYLTIKH